MPHGRCWPKMHHYRTSMNSMKPMEIILRIHRNYLFELTTMMDRRRVFWLMKLWQFVMFSLFWFTKIIENQISIILWSKFYLIFIWVNSMIVDQLFFLTIFCLFRTHIWRSSKANWSHSYVVSCFTQSTFIHEENRKICFVSNNIIIDGQLLMETYFSLVFVLLSFSFFREKMKQWLSMMNYLRRQTSMVLFI